MDIKKDNQIIQKDKSIYGFIGDSEYKKFLLKKTEKIVSVLYVVSKFFPQQDILTESLRKESMGLLSFVNHTVISSSGWSNDSLDKTKQFMVSIISLLGVARLSGFISDMNYNIIIPELQSFVEMIQEKSGENDLSISQDVFMSPVAETESQNSFKSKIFTQTKNQGFLNKRQKENNKGHIKDNKDTGEKRQDRRGLIVDFFKLASKPVSVKDVAFSVKNCSEKTIQRELISMVQEGVLLKEGERRWSRYTLV